MFGARLCIKGELALLSALHIGTGDTETFEHVTKPAETEGGKRQQVPVATILCDGDGLPLIPGATIKGVLRALAGGTSGCDALFGPSSGSENLSQGRLTAWSARLVDRQRGETERAALAVGLPFTCKLERQALTADDRRELTEHGRRGLFVTARTAIDPATGTAEEKRLFYREMVPAGARFRLRLQLMLDGNQDDAANAEELLTNLLQRLTATDGVAFGHGQSAGHGRAQLDRDTLIFEHIAIGSDGRLVKNAKPVLTEPCARADPDIIHLTLTCDGPFIVDDSARRPERKRTDEEHRLPQLNAQEGPDGKPILPGTSLMGVLRRRAAFLARLRWNDERNGDDRDRILAFNNPAAVERDKKGRTVIRPEDLTPSERLFGVTGWRGLVRLGPIECTSCARFENITSVRLDRFSMAPIDGGLFTTRAAIDPVFEVTLKLEHRAGFPNADDTALFEALLKDLLDEGIMLGHGTSRGYGWFRVERSASGTDT